MDRFPRFPDEIDRRVAARLHRRRLALGLEARLLDAAIGEKPGTLDKFETCARRIGAAQLFRLGQVLGVDVAYFFVAEPGAALPEGGADAADGRRTGEAQRFARAVAAITDPEVRGTIRSLVETIADAAAGADDEEEPAPRSPA